MNLKKIDNFDIDALFPDLNETIKYNIDTKEEFKKDITNWIENELNGPQFNAIRMCSLPKNLNDTTTEVGFCEYYKLCPLFKHGNAPVGELCPVEKFQVNQLTQELIDELKIDLRKEATDKQLIGELIVFSLLEQRAIRALAATSLDRLVVTIGKFGKTYEKQENYYLNTIKTLQEFKRSLRKSLIATREEKIKMNRDVGGDNKPGSSTASSIKEKIAKAESVRHNQLGLIVEEVVN